MGNSSPEKVCLYRALAWLCPPCWWMNCFLKTAEVPAGSVRMMEDGRGGFDFLGNSGPQQGIHLYWDLFYRVGQSVELNKSAGFNAITVHNGDQWIVVVPQGFIGLAEDMGQPVLLPPGMHQWRSATMHFDRCVDLGAVPLPMVSGALLGEWLLLRPPDALRSSTVAAALAEMSGFGGAAAPAPAAAAGGGERRRVVAHSEVTCQVLPEFVVSAAVQADERLRSNLR